MISIYVCTLKNVLSHCTYILACQYNKINTIQYNNRVTGHKVWIIYGVMHLSVFFSGGQG